jgi:hypothetical protein
MGGTAKPTKRTSGRLQGKVFQTKDEGYCCERRGLYGSGTKL